jgi:hypothetical protein
MRFDFLLNRHATGHDKTKGAGSMVARILQMWVVQTQTLMKEVTECDKTESDQTRHYALLESDKRLLGMR